MKELDEFGSPTCPPWLQKKNSKTMHDKSLYNKWTKARKELLLAVFLEKGKVIHEFRDVLWEMCRVLDMNPAKVYVNAMQSKGGMSATDEQTKKVNENENNIMSAIKSIQ
jgi:hypothetical protein